MTAVPPLTMPSIIDTTTLPAICIVGPMPPPSGGMANQCEQLVRLLRHDGLKVELVRNNAPYRPAWVVRIPGVRALFRLVPYLVNLWRAAGRAQVVHVLANSGWAWYLFAAPAVWIGTVRGCKVIVNYRGGNADSFFARARGPVLGTLRLASARVTPSGYLQRVFQKYDLDTVIVPNIIDLSRFRPAPRREFGDAPHLIVTRNLEPIYDVPTAIHAFAAVRRVFPNAHLTIAGTGPEQDRLRALVDELGLKASVRFSGRIENAAIPALYASADCMLNPSTVDNMPISILEAFATGVPVVSTDAGGIPDIAEDGVSAQLGEVGDFAKMGQHAIRILRDAAMAESMREAGMKAAARYAWPIVRQQWLHVYRRVADHQEE